MHYLAENNTFAPRKLSKNAKILSENQRWPQQKGTFHILRKHFKWQMASKTVKIVSKKCPKSVQNCQIQRKLKEYSECPEVSRSLQKCPKVSQNLQKSPKSVQKASKECSRVSKSVQKCPKVSKSVQKVSIKVPKYAYVIYEWSLRRRCCH